MTDYTGLDDKDKWQTKAEQRLAAARNIYKDIDIDPANRIAELEAEIVNEAVAEMVAEIIKESAKVIESHEPYSRKEQRRVLKT